MKMEYDAFPSSSLLCSVLASLLVGIRIPICETHLQKKRIIREQKTPIYLLAFNQTYFITFHFIKKPRRP